MNQDIIKQIKVPLFLTVYDGSKTKKIYRGWNQPYDIEHIPFTYRLIITIENKWSGNILFKPNPDKPNRYGRYTYRKNVICFKLVKEYLYQ